MVSHMRTVLCEILSRSDSTDARKSDVHDAKGTERREKVRYDVSTLKVRLDGGDIKRSIIGGLGLNEGAQEVKSEAC